MSDFDPEMILGSRQNTPGSDLMLADATQLPLSDHSVDAVVTDFPYGQSVCIKKADTMDMTIPYAAGGLYSTVEDLYHWDQALYTEKLVSRRTLELAFTPGPATDHPNTGYGFGWYIGQYRGVREIWHSGTSRGFSTRIACGVWVGLDEKKTIYRGADGGIESAVGKRDHQVAHQVVQVHSLHRQLCVQDPGVA